MPSLVKIQVINVSPRAKNSNRNYNYRGTRITKDRNMDTIEIIIDDREQRSDVIDAMTQRKDINFTIERLTLGDYLIDNWLLIERKQLKDLIESLLSGRLFSQASRLASSPFKTAILLEGSAKDVADYKIHRHSLLGTLVTLTLVFGISILRSANACESVALMSFAARQKSNNVKTELPRFGRRPKSTKGRQLFILQGLPGVGPKTAKRLLAKFGSIKAIFMADVEQLRTVEGIGPEKAKTIIEIIA